MQLNPYESPIIAEEPCTATSPQWLMTYAQFIGTGTLTNALVGMGTMAFYAWDSPEYFTAVMRWSTNDLWIKAIFKGALDGAIFGVLLSAIFIVVAGQITHGLITYARAIEKLLWIAIGAVSLSYLAGTIAAMCADGMPDPMRELLPMAPGEPRRFFRFAFVTVSMNLLPWSAALFAAVHLYFLYYQELRERTNKLADANRAVSE